LIEAAAFTKNMNPASIHYPEKELNVKAILSAAGIAALLASPAMAQQGRPLNTPQPNIPKDARASVAPPGANEGGP
jgi:hypothetical protein